MTQIGQTRTERFRRQNDARMPTFIDDADRFLPGAVLRERRRMPARWCWLRK